MTTATGWMLGPALMLCKGDGELAEVMMAMGLFPLLFSLVQWEASTMAWMMGWYLVPFGKSHLSFERLSSFMWKMKGLWHLVQLLLLTSNCPSSHQFQRVVFGRAVRGLRGRCSGAHFSGQFKGGMIITRFGMEFHCNCIQLCATFSMVSLELDVKFLQGVKPIF